MEKRYNKSSGNSIQESLVAGRGKSHLFEKTTRPVIAEFGSFDAMTNSQASPQVFRANPAIGAAGDLHIFFPRERKAPPAWIYAIHGGAWRNGDQTSYARFWDTFATLGVALILPSYRKTPEYPFPCAYEDVLAGLQWLRANGTELGLDMERGALMGSSAGGHLAMLLATRGISENENLPGIRAVAQYCGIMDTEAQATWDRENSRTMTEHFLPSNSPDLPSKYQLSSPVHHISSRTPEVWMAHGTADAVVPVSQSRRMVQALREAGHDPIYLEARGLGHTCVEVGTDSAILESGDLLFKQDLLRFLSRALS